MDSSSKGDNVSCKLYVKNIKPDTDVEGILMDLGEVVEVNYKKDKTSAVVTFAEKESVIKALELDPEDFKFFNVYPYKTGKISSVFVSGFGPKIKNEDLNELFQGFGKIIKLDRYKSYAIIQFTDGTDIKEALKLNERILDGKELSVKPFKGKKIYVSGLSDDYKPKEIFDMFAEFGYIDTTKRGINYMIIKYSPKASDEKIRQSLNLKGKKLGSSTLDVKYMEELRSHSVENKLYVFCPPKIELRELQDLFGRHGCVEVILKKHNKHNHAIVIFSNKDDAREALRSLDGYLIGDFRLGINYYKEFGNPKLKQSPSPVKTSAAKSNPTQSKPVAKFNKPTPKFNSPSAGFKKLNHPNTFVISIDDLFPNGVTPREDNYATLKFKLTPYGELEIKHVNV